LFYQVHITSTASYGFTVLGTVTFFILLRVSEIWSGQEKVHGTTTLGTKKKVLESEKA